MKLTRLLLIAGLGLPMLAWGRPATPNPVQYKNPDGSVTNIRLYGDADFSYTTDIDSENILELDARGFWQPAVRNGRMLKAIESDIKILRAETPVLKEDSEQGANVSRMAALDNNGRTKFPSVGEEVHCAVVLIEYSDTPFTVPDIKQAYEDMLNGDNYTAYGSCGSARQYFMDSSNGQFKPIFDIYGPVKVPYTSEFCTGLGTSLPGAGKNARFGYAIKSALDTLTEEGVDFSIYDYDEDNTIDNIFFFYSGFGQADTGKQTYVWPHQGDFQRYCYDFTLNLDPIVLNGKRFGPYACTNELNNGIPKGAKQPYLDGIGAFCHETSHVLGLPDLYNASSQSGYDDTPTKTPGKWSIMDQGSYNEYSTRPPLYSAYEMWLCRWLEYIDAEDETTYTLPPLTSDDRQAVRLRIRRPSPTVQYTQEYFVVENRGHAGWDLSTPENGILIWRIAYDKTSWKENTVNSGGKPKVEIIGADEELNKWAYAGTNPDMTAVYPGQPGELVPTGINAFWNPFLLNMKIDPQTKNATFEYNYLQEVPDITTVLHDDPVRPEDGTRAFTLTWDAAEGADSYCVTVTRTDAAGRRFIVDNFYEKNVGNVTSCVVSNLSTAAFKQNIEAYVRVVSTIPCSETSNVISFVPNELKTAGIEDAFADGIVIRGLKGCIEAPEGAEIFNMNGHRTGADNLPAGIYLVKAGEKVVKVAVR